MKILAISHLYPHVAEPRYGIFVARQLQAMAQEGAEVTLLVPRVFCPPWLRRLRGRPASYDHTLALCNFEGINAIPVPYFGLPGAGYNAWAGTAAYRAMRRQARQLHAAQQFEVMYATSLFLSGDTAIQLRRDLNIPATSLAIGADVNVTPNLSARLHKKYLQIVQDLDGALACGESLSQRLDAIRDDRSLCVYGVVDLEQFSPVRNKASLRQELGLPSHGTMLLYAGYLWKRKGLLELIEAFESIHAEQPDATLVVCGHGDEEAVIQRAAHESKCSSAIHFMGVVSPAEIHRFMQASDIFVLPSYAEGMPNAVMEAMACGIPVVTTTVGGLPMALADCDGATLVPPQQTEPLALALRSLLRDETRRNQMARAAREKAESSFGARPNARKILRYLDSVVQRHNVG